MCGVQDVSDKLTDSATYRACLMETNRRVICVADTDCVCVGEVQKSSRKLKTRIGRRLPLLDDRKNSKAELEGLYQVEVLPRHGRIPLISEEQKTKLENFKFEQKKKETSWG